MTRAKREEEAFGMRRKLGGVFSFLAALLLLAGVLLTSLQMTINQNGYFAALSTRLETGKAAGISDGEAAAALDHLVDFMEGRVQDIQLTVEIDGKAQTLFTQDEITHMNDVQKLYRTARLGRDLCLIAAAALYALALLLGRPRPFRLWAGGYLAAGGLLAIVGGAMAVWAIRDFDGFWSQMHRLLFTNDLWLMDPAKSKMILLCPAELFQDILCQAGLWTLLIAIVLAVLSILCLTRRPKMGRREATPGRGGKVTKPKRKS